MKESNGHVEPLVTEYLSVLRPALLTAEGMAKEPNAETLMKTIGSIIQFRIHACETILMGLSMNRPELFTRSREMFDEAEILEQSLGK